MSSNLENDPPWLSDFTRAAQHLTRLTLESSAQAALITRDDELWAYAGQLSQTATLELTDTVSRYWDRQKENDLARFIHLASTGAEHMLYATRLTQNMVLALIFDAETPFGTIHSQANQLVRSLSPSLPGKQDLEERTDDENPFANQTAFPTGRTSPNLNTDGKTVSQKYIRETSLTFSIDPMVSTTETEPSIEIGKTDESPRYSWNNRPKRNPEEDDLVTTRPNTFGEEARRIVLEPISASVYNLDYACLLIPRFPHHHLIGDLSDHLPDYLQDNCIAFAWRLEYISVRPDYLIWIVNVPPATSPAYLMRIMRQRTSVRIFDDFSRFSKDNPSGDFWAPGYLIMGGSQPPPVQLIKEFIAQTRQRQGIPYQPR